MATGTFKSIGNVVKTKIVELKGTFDFPLVFVETGNEDYKGIMVKDANDQNRYTLVFKGGHLYFSSRDASGNPIVNDAQII